MACLNCTARVLRLFIHDTASPALRHTNALRRPVALQQYPRRLAQFQQLRRESTFVTNQDQENAVNDDEYLPFVSSFDLPLPAERITVDLLRPPPPPPMQPESSEPDIVIRDLEGAVFECGSHSGNQDAEPSPKLTGGAPRRVTKKHHHPPKASKAAAAPAAPAVPKEKRWELRMDASKVGEEGVNSEGRYQPLRAIEPEVEASIVEGQHPSLRVREYNPNKRTPAAPVVKEARSPRVNDRQAARPRATQERGQSTRKRSATASDGFKDRAFPPVAKATSKPPRNTGEWDLPPLEDPETLIRMGEWKLPAVPDLAPTPESDKLQWFVANKKAREVEPWKLEKAAAARKYGDRGYNPFKRLSPEAMEGLRALHSTDPVEFSTARLAERFEISPEAVRRVLKSKWKKTADEIAKQNARWENRGDTIFMAKVESGDIKTKSMIKHERRVRRSRTEIAADRGPPITARIA